MKFDIKIQKTDYGNIIILDFMNSQENMNYLLDDISNKYEETVIIGRIIHNFPLSAIPNNHKLYKILKKFIDFNEAKYIIDLYDNKLFDVK